MHGLLEAPWACLLLLAGLRLPLAPTRAPCGSYTEQKLRELLVPEKNHNSGLQGRSQRLQPTHKQGELPSVLTSLKGAEKDMQLLSSEPIRRVLKGTLWNPPTLSVTTSSLGSSLHCFMGRLPANTGPSPRGGCLQSCHQYRQGFQCQHSQEFPRHLSVNRTEH